MKKFLQSRKTMNLEELFNQNNIIELSFFNFRNAITAAYFANRDLEIRRVNKNFKKFFPILGNVSNAYFPDVLEQLGLPSRQIDEFVTGLNENGSILIPQIEIEIDPITQFKISYQLRKVSQIFTYQVIIGESAINSQITISKLLSVTIF